MLLSKYFKQTILFVGLLGAFLSLEANAVLTIEITKGAGTGVPIAIVPFEFRGSEPPPFAVSDIVESDLHHSGRFDPIARTDFLGRPSDHTQVRFKDWRLIKAEALVVGRILQAGKGYYTVQFQLFDVFSGRQLGGRRYRVSLAQLRRLAHQISDYIYEKLVGERGAFDTRIVYVTVRQLSSGTRQYLLSIADSDGYRPQVMKRSSSPILSPAWSPDGRQLAYVSFENGHATLFIQRISDGKRVEAASYPGINGAPAWSPDGKRLAMTLSRDGNTEVYVLMLKHRRLQRLTRNTAIDTEPAWSPDGRSIIFTSDRGGKPQIYRIAAAGGQVRRVTFQGRYNARASWSPDGKKLVMVTDQGQGAGYQIATLDLATKALTILTEGRLDESPSFAPNGAMILYAARSGRRGVLHEVSADGRVTQALTSQQGDVREPAWSPFQPNY